MKWVKVRVLSFKEIAILKVVVVKGLSKKETCLRDLEAAKPYSREAARLKLISAESSGRN